jgi:ABC-type nickel/cobalt efflux system permease component RcnA
MADYANRNIPAVYAMMRRHIVALCVGLFIVLAVAPSWAANPFMRGSGGGADDAPARVTRSAPESPGLFAALYAKSVTIQRDLRTGLSGYVRRLKTSSSPWELMLFLGLAFVYGVVHAAGPGHGKSVASSYFLSRGGSVGQGVALGLGMGATHAASASLVVGGVYLVVQRTSMTNFAAASATIEQASYLLITLLGAWLVWSAVAGMRGAEGEGDAPVVPATRRSLWAVTLSAGIIPCPGAALILLFACAQQALVLGLGAVVAMAAGMGVTIAAASVVAVCCRGVMLRSCGARRRWQRIVRHTVSLGAAVVVFGFGLMLLMGSVG